MYSKYLLKYICFVCWLLDWWHTMTMSLRTKVSIINIKNNFWNLTLKKEKSMHKNIIILSIRCYWTEQKNINYSFYKILLNRTKKL